MNQGRIEEDISFAEVVRNSARTLKFLASKWKWLILFTALFASLGYTYSRLAAPKYVATTTLMLEDGKSGGGLAGYMQLAQQFGLMGGNGGGGLDAEKVVELLKSKRIIFSALLRKADFEGKHDLLANHYLEIGGYKKQFEKNESPLKDFAFTSENPENLSIREDSIIDMMYNAIAFKFISITKQKTSGIIELKVETRSEWFSQILSKYLVEELSTFYFSHKTQKERENLVVIQARADSVFDALTQAENNYAQWKDANTNHLVKVKGQIEEVRLRRHVEILQAMYTEVIKNLEIAKFNYLIKTPVLQVIDKPRLPLDKIVRSKRLFIVLGALLGFILTCGYFLAKQQLTLIFDGEKNEDRTI